MSTQHVLGFSLLAALVACLGLLAWASGYRRRRIAQRAAFIRKYAFPAELRRRIGEAHPEWSFTQIDRVLDGLRQYFLACLSAQVGTPLARQLGMPSRAVDDAWHAFIVITRDYAQFCTQAFGRYLHHTPHTMMAEPMDKNLANTLHHVRHPAPGMAVAAAGAMAVPLLFALDRELGMAHGFQYDEGAMAALEAKRKMLLASHGSADGASGGTECAASDAGCGDGGGSGGCGGGGGCGGS